MKMVGLLKLTSCGLEPYLVRKPDDGSIWVVVKTMVLLWVPLILGAVLY